jgi:hypothetical protein
MNKLFAVIDLGVPCPLFLAIFGDRNPKLVPLRGSYLRSDTRCPPYFFLMSSFN